MHSHNHNLSKTPYQSPKLFVYGDIRELTKNSTTASSMGDNPSQPPDLTHKSSSF